MYGARKKITTSSARKRKEREIATAYFAGKNPQYCVDANVSHMLDGLHVGDVNPFTGRRLSAATLRTWGDKVKKGAVRRANYARCPIGDDGAPCRSWYEYAVNPWTGRKLRKTKGKVSATAKMVDRECEKRRSRKSSTPRRGASASIAATIPASSSAKKRRRMMKTPSPSPAAAKASASIAATIPAKRKTPTPIRSSRTSSSPAKKKQRTSGDALPSPPPPPHLPIPSKQQKPILVDDDINKLEIYEQQKPEIIPHASVDRLKNHFRNGVNRPVVTFQNDDDGTLIALKNYLGGGNFGEVFSGSYGRTGEAKVAIKINTVAIGRISRTAGKRVKSIQSFNDFANEYNTMAQLNCDVDDPNICAYAAFGIVMNGVIYGCMVMEEMDGIAEDFVDPKKTAWIPSFEKHIEYRSAIVLKAIKNIRRLHDMGLFHMDAHHKNWFIRYKYGARFADPFDVNFQVKLGDMGESCAAAMTKYDRTPKCEAVSDKYPKQSRNYKHFFKYPGLIEYIQFMKLLLILMPRRFMDSLFARMSTGTAESQRLHDIYAEEIRIEKSYFNVPGIKDIDEFDETRALKDRSFDYIFFERANSIGRILQKMALEGLLGDPNQLADLGLIPYYQP